MRFSKEYIEKVRETLGEEDAAQLEKANAEEDHRERVARFETDPDIAKRFPRMAYALKTKQISLPFFPDDASAEEFMAQQENLLVALKAPLPGEEQKQAEQAENASNAGENAETQSQSPRDITGDMLGQRPGMVPWSEDATQAVLRPTQPGPGANQLTVVVSEIDDLMDPEPGRFKRSRDRDFQLIRGMEIANRMTGGTQELRAMRKAHEDPDVFPI